MKRRIFDALVIGLAVIASPVSFVEAQETSVADTSAVTQETFVWASPDGKDQLATVYLPADTASGAPMVVDVHGGAWGAYDRTADRVYAEGLAATGIVVMSIDFRQAPDVQHPTSSADVASAVRYAKLNAARFGASPEKVGVIGSSSGGHLVMLEGVRPNVPQHLGVAISASDGGFAVHDDTDATPAFIVGLWPVSDPAARYRYARRAGITQLVEMHDRYFADEDAMWDASIARIVSSGEAKHLPPLMIVQPGEDSNIPQSMTFDVMEAWQARNGYLEYAFFPGQKHAFGHFPGEATDKMISAVSSFILRQSAD